MATVSYLGFLLAFVLPPLFVLTAIARWRSLPLDRIDRLGLAIILVLALGYTTPWDNYLVASGVWEYRSGTVVARLWHAPIEEYAFIALQSVVTWAWLRHLPRVDAPAAVSRRARLGGVVAGLSVGILGVGLLSWPGTFYLGAILAWGAPVLALQWGFGWPYLWRARRTVALGVAVPTLYFALADRIAITLGIWTFSPRFLTGIEVLGLPIEEGVFFLLTNLFVVQGLVLFRWVIDRWN